ncbi:hypothetical protein [Aeromicrobium sp. UC242_57]|uniref:hypothetical protein n=1 Tax=Aeromicrobium sp. UC242_57 TaxID=3374624 RepID=UPI0037A7D42D
MSRSLIALASLALASAALAVPASAAASDISRSQILHALDMVRDDPAVSGGNPYAASPATNRALRVLANRACSVNHDKEVVFASVGLPVAPGDSADGLLVMSMIADPSSILSMIGGSPSAEMSGRYCFFGALAATGSSATLSGTAKLTTASTKAMHSPVTPT